MTKDEIKKALELHVCELSCDGCSYEESGSDCFMNLWRDVFDLITEQEQEIEKLENEIWDMQDKLGCYHSEIKRQRKQAKIEVLESLKTGRCGAIKCADGEWVKCVRLEDIDEMIANLKGETE